MPDLLQPAKAGRFNVVLDAKHNALLLELHSLYSRRLNKRLPYTTVIKVAIEKLAELEKIKA